MGIPAICSVDGCDNPARPIGMCQKHYHRMWRNGTLEIKRAAKGDAEKFIEQLVADRDDGQDCIQWPFCDKGNGYGVLTYKGQDDTYAHRAVCEEINGPPPSPGHYAAHSCGNGHDGCVQPNHLRWATPKENGKDMVSHGRSQRGQRNCNVKLSEDDVRLIRKLYPTVSQADLGKKFGVNQASISAIIIRRTWAWLA